MKTGKLICLFLFLFIATVFISENRIKDERSRYMDFILQEQRSFRKLEESGEIENQPTGVQYAALQEYYKTLDPSELRVPLERLRPGLEQTNRKKAAMPVFAEEGLNMLWHELDSDLGGRIRAVMWDPNDPERKKVWAGGVTGGLWYRDDIFDDNRRWEVVSDFWEGLSVSCIDYDPLNTQNYYAGTGEGQTARVIYRESSGRGFGILKSENAGKTWNILPSTRGFAYITDIAIREENNKAVIYAGVVSGEYKSKLIESTPGDGLYRSEDGGTVWEQVLPDVPGTQHGFAPSDIEISRNGRIFVGTGESPDGSGAGFILWSDDGSNWTIIDEYEKLIRSAAYYNQPGRVLLCSAPSDGNYIYAFLTAAGGEFYSFKSPRGTLIAGTTDGGVTWEKLITPSRDEAGGWAYIAWHALACAVNPSDPEKLFAGGLDLYTSHNRGETWKQVSSWYNFTNTNTELPLYVHADQHTIRFRPGSDREALFTTDGGVFLAEDADLKIPVFKEKNHGLNTLQYYTCAIHPEVGRHFFLAGAQDNGTLVYRNEKKPVSIRNNVSYGDGTFCFIDEDQPLKQLSGSQFNYVYATNVGLDYGYMENEIYYNQGGIFVNPMDYDSRRNVLYSNTCDFYGRSADSLMKMNNFESRVKAFSFPLGTGTRVPFSAIRVSPWSDEYTVVFAGSQDGRLFRIHDAENYYQLSNRFEVTEIGSPEFPAGNIVCIETGENEDQLLVLFSNYGAESVWETRDGGQSWKNKDLGLPDIPVRWAVYHPQNYNQVLLATEAGLWMCVNIQEENCRWFPVRNFPTVRVDMLRLRKSDLAVVAATHGRGLWFSPGFPLYSNEMAERDLKVSVFPNPAHDIVTISMSVISDRDMDLRIFDYSGKEVLHIQEFITEGEYSSPADLSSLEEGIYILRLENGEFSASSSFLLIR